MGVTDDDLAELSPNMRKALRECSNHKIGSKDTYWITLQGLAGRGLVTRPQTYNGYYHLTELGVQYLISLKCWNTVKETP